MDYEYCTALQIAKEAKRNAIVELFLDHGAHTEGHFEGMWTELCLIASTTVELATIWCCNYEVSKVVD